MPQAYGNTHHKKSTLGLLAVLLLGLIGGCAHQQQLVGPTTLAPYRTGPWDRRYPASSTITSAHYRLFTDLQDPQAIDQLVQVMEGAHQQYRAICPSLSATTTPLRCYVFARRAEWAEFTNKNNGEDAAVFLRIDRGGYSVDDWFAAFWLGDGTFATASHEGWHQFLGRHFAARMPPSLEEGIACTFENVQWLSNLPRWDLKTHPARLEALEKAYEDGTTCSLAELLRLQAGDVIHLPKERVSTFYAQAWAMALFLLDEQSPYRPAMQRYLAELASGAVYRPEKFSHLRLRDWHPSLSQPQLEHYLGRPISQIEPEYAAFCKRLISGRTDAARTGVQ